MANLEIAGENLGCYLYIYINDSTYCIDKDNCKLNLELPLGKHTVTIIGTKTKDYHQDNSLKSMSFRIKPALIQGYKDKGILNHILGWKNKTYFFIKKINVDVRFNSKINLKVKDFYVYNFFDVKETVKDVEITTNSHIKTISTQSFNFISKNQKIRYYTIQFLLLLLKFCLNCSYMVWAIIDEIANILNPEAYIPVYVKHIHIPKLEIFFDSLFFLAFFIRFIFYCTKICKNLRDNSDVLLPKHKK